MLKKEFDQLAEALGSTFAAVNFIAKLAREKREQSNYSLLESEAISWVLTGKEPPKNRYPKSDILHHVFEISDLLSEIDDEEVAESVWQSYEISLKEHHLIYQYQEGMCEGQKARVRILSRMIWYNIQQEGRFIQ